MSTLGIIAGMQVELACLDTAPTQVNRRYDLRYSAGGSPGRARYGAKKLLTLGADRLVSFGIAGALDPSLLPGDIVIATEVLNGYGFIYKTNSDWRLSIEKSNKCKTTIHHGKIFTSEQPIATTKSKSEVFINTNAVAVDMESSGVAIAAQEANVPFLAIRAIADPASRPLPSLALTGLAPNGSTRVLKAATALIYRPWELAETLRLIRSTAIAFNALRSIAAIGM